MMNKQQVTILVLLDFSAAFDTVDLSILRDTNHAFFSSRLGYCNSLLYGLPEYQIQKLQRVQNSAAYYTITKSPTLVTRSKSNSFKTLLLIVKAIHKLAPTYISGLVSLKDTSGRYYH